jgi:serine protease DegQ
MLRLWLLFSQAVTICVAALFVVATFRPEWLPQRAALSNAPPVTVVQQVATQPRRRAARASTRTTKRSSARRLQW